MKSEIKYIPIKQLKAWGKNPRKNDKAAEKLVKLIEAHGFINPVICTRDNTIRAGHTRVKAANKAGLKEVPVIYVDMDEEQASAFAIADNKSSQYSEWDFELLKDVFEELDAFNYDLELTGFDMAEVEGLMTYTGDYANKNKEIDIDSLDETMTIKLNFTEAEYWTVKQQLSEIAATPEQAIWKLLGNE
jgi:ParB-like chromosome segregation protein Spo0J